MSCFKDLRGVKWNVSKMESGKHPYTHNPWTSLGGGQFQYPLRKKGIIPLFLLYYVLIMFFRDLSWMSKYKLDCQSLGQTLIKARDIRDKKQWMINLCTLSMMINKLTRPVDSNHWWKSLKTFFIKFGLTCADFSHFWQQFFVWNNYPKHLILK